jgi:hypothetical protein
MKKAAVVIGVNKTGKLTPLSSAAEGAKRVADWLTGEGYDVCCLTDLAGPVTRGDVEKAIEAYVTLPARYHLLLVYFSGHGYWQARSDTWLLSGAPRRPSEAINLRTAIDMAKYSGIPNVVFVSDACRSIPDTRGGASLEPTGAFPNYDEITTPSKVDYFKATSEARPAYEGRIDGAPQSVLTAALMAAFHEPESQMVRSIVDGNETIEVVPNRRLETYLQRKVDELLACIDPNAVQQIEVNVPSSEDVYIARVRRGSDRPPTSGSLPETSPPEASLPEASPPVSSPPSAPLPSGSVEGEALAVPRGPGEARREMADALRSTLSTRAFGGSISARLARPYEASVETSLGLRMPDPAQDHFESHTGFVVHGSAVLRVVASRSEASLEARLLNPGGGGSPGLVRVETPGSMVVPEGQATSVGMQFEDRRCVVLAALPGYVGHVFVKRSGLANVSYVPSSNDWRWAEYLARRDDINRLRAMVALAVDRDLFQVGSEREAEALASRIRMYKGMDPTLGLYAADAFSQAGNDSQVLAVLEALRADLQVDLFDLRLLASRQLGGWESGPPVVPFCPMLTQSWNLLSARRVDLPAPLRSLMPWLCNSLWTTFEPEAADTLMASMLEGELR